jgi:glutathione S-transferase
LIFSRYEWSDMKLIIGNKNYSSWSLRAWLLMRVNGIEFEEERIPLEQPNTKASILKHSPAGRVPVLIDGHTTAWDTLAIVEYLAEKFPSLPIWPQELKARAYARSISAEMHSGFTALRTAMPMNCRGSYPGKGINAESLADITRITALWEESRERFGSGGEFLLGRFSAADAFYAPVASRFITYAVPLKPVAQAYVAAISALPAMREWVAAGKAESEVLNVDEPYR